MVDLRLKIEKEFDENPLLRNLGVTIYGSLYESRHQAAATGAASTGTAATGAIGAAATSHHASKSHHKTVVCQCSKLNF